MKYLVVLISICSANAIKENCDVRLHGVPYKAETLLSDIDRPTNLAIDKSHERVYFVYGHGKYFNTSKHAIFYLKSNELTDILSESESYAKSVVIDNFYNEIFLGRSDGIHRYNYNGDTATLILGEIGVIWHLYLNKHALYFQSDLFFNLFKMDEFIDAVPEFINTSVRSIVIDEDGVMFYSNNTGIYRQRKETSQVSVYKTFESDTRVAFALDNNDNVYACLRDGIYFLHKNTTILEKVLDVDDGFGLIFDGHNNLIYSDATNLVRLTKC